jgi:hypothetical protein
MQNTPHLVVIKFSLIVVGLGSFLLNGERSWAQVPAQKLIPATPSLRATTLTPAQPKALRRQQHPVKQPRRRLSSNCRISE